MLQASLRSTEVTDFKPTSAEISDHKAVPLETVCAPALSRLAPPTTTPGCCSSVRAKMAVCGLASFLWAIVLLSLATRGESFSQRGCAVGLFGARSLLSSSDESLWRRVREGELMPRLILEPQN